MLTIVPFTPELAGAVLDLQRRYVERYPGAPVIPGEVYLSPGFSDGQDVFCAVSNGGELLAYAPLYVQIVEGPGDLPHVGWTDIKADPELPDSTPIKDALLQRILTRAEERAAGHPGRGMALKVEHLPHEQQAVDYVRSRGFAYVESGYQMLRDLSVPVDPVDPPPGITIRPWKMEKEGEQEVYVAARNACFPEAPLALDNWKYYLTSPRWAAGTTIAAFAGDALVGNVNIYWDPSEPQPLGNTEDVFVLAGWRGRGVARAMIIEALCYLQEHGLPAAKLYVRAANENALSLYTSLGYRVAAESRFYARMLLLNAAGR